METEWTEGRAREAGRPARRAKGGVHARYEPKSRERRCRSQSPHSSEEAPVTGVERRAGRKVEGVEDRTTEERPPRVPPGVKQGGDIQARWAWAEPTFWPERMLAALEQGAKGGKWFGPTPTLPRTGCSPWPQPMRWPANPLAGEPLTGEPYAGKPLVRFGGGRDRDNRSFLPLSKQWEVKDQSVG